VVLQECIEPFGCTITDAAAALGVTRNHAFGTRKTGSAAYPPKWRVRLSKVFGGTEEGWLVQQAQYDLSQVRRGPAEAQAIGNWLKRDPAPSIGCLEKGSLLQQRRGNYS